MLEEDVARLFQSLVYFDCHEVLKTILFCAYLRFKEKILQIILNQRNAARTELNGY